MIDLAPALRAFLLADPVITAAVADRVYPVVLPQGERRASVVYTLVSELGDHHMQGPSGLARPRYQIDAYATDADDADELARAISDRLDGFKGQMGDGGSPETFVRVKGAFFDAKRDDFQPESELHRVSQDFLIWFDEL